MLSKKSSSLLKHSKKKKKDEPNLSKNDFQYFTEEKNTTFQNEESVLWRSWFQTPQNKGDPRIWKPKIYIFYLLIFIVMIQTFYLLIFFFSYFKFDSFIFFLK